MLHRLRFYIGILRRCLSEPIHFSAWGNYLLYCLFKPICRRVPLWTRLPYYPVSATVWVTARCNLKCKFCHYDGELRKPTDQETGMNFEAFLGIYERTPELRRALRIALYGGEPLLRAELPRFVSFLKQRGHIVSINTNGLLLKKRWPELRDDPPHFLSVSHYPENVKALNAVLPEIGREVPIRLGFVAMRNNLDRLEEFFADARRWNVAWVAVDNFVDNGREIESVGTKDELFFTERKRLNGIFGRDFVIEWPPVYRPRRRTRCAFFWNSTFVDERGRFSACCTWKRESYREQKGNYWNAQPMRALRLAMSRNQPPAACTGCRGLYDDTSAV